MKTALEVATVSSLRMMEVQNTLRDLDGDQYAKRQEPYRTLVRSTPPEKRLGVAIEASKGLQDTGHAIAALRIIAAAADFIVEREDEEMDS